MMSLITITTGPVLIAGSIFNFRKSNGVKEPIRVATATARMIPKPTVMPKAGELCSRVSARNTMVAPQTVPKMMPLSSPTLTSLLRTRVRLSLWISPVASPRTMTVAPWIPTFPARPSTKGIKKMTAVNSLMEI